jgi:hypothetical protein
VRQQPNVPSDDRTGGQRSRLHEGRDHDGNGRGGVPVYAAGSDADLAARLDTLEHKFKLLSTEWSDKESRIDSILKRVHRLRKLEEERAGAGPETEADPPAPAATAAQQRAAIWRKAQGGT